MMKHNTITMKVSSADARLLDDVLMTILAGLTPYEGVVDGHTSTTVGVLPGVVKADNEGNKVHMNRRIIILTNVGPRTVARMAKMDIPHDVKVKIS